MKEEKKEQCVMRYLVVVVVLSLFALYGSTPLFLPQPLPETAPADQFSAVRAMQHVAVIGREIHPAGSPTMADVATYLKGTLEMIGLQPGIQETEAQRGGDTIKLRNVVVRLPGTTSNGAVLFLTHPDSTPFGPGAGDNATGVAVLLEVARALKAGPALQNDIILLFDDGEEYGYLGGYAFAREHPWVADIRLAVGLDTAAWGPVVLLQTAPQNEMLIRGYAQAVPSPVAFGFFADANWNIARDDSEIQPFVENGLPGLALEDPTAFAGKHASSDTVDRVNPASLQQMGDQVLAIARQYGNMDLSQVHSGDDSYFTLWGLGVVHYPASINIVLVVLTVLGFPGLVVLGIRRKVFSSKGVGIGSLASLGVVVLAAMIGLIAAGLFNVWFPKPHQHIDNYLVPASLPFLVVTLVLIVSLHAAGRRWLTRKLGATNLAVAGLTPWLVMSLVFIGLLPIGSYLFIWPLLLAVAIWGGLVIGRMDAASSLGRTTLAVPAVVATVLVTPNLVLIYLGTGVAILSLITVLVFTVLDLWAPVWN
jgi:hypothetical protein